MRFYLIFGYDLTNNYKEFETKCIGSLSSDNNWKKFIETDLNKNYRKPAILERQSILAKFKEYKDYKSKFSKMVTRSDWNSLNKEEKKK